MKFFDIVYDNIIGEWYAYCVDTGYTICFHGHRKECIEKALKAGYTLI